MLDVWQEFIDSMQIVDVRESIVVQSEQFEPLEICQMLQNIRIDEIIA